MKLNEMDQVHEFVRIYKLREYQVKKFGEPQPGMTRTLEEMARDFNNKQIDQLLKIWRKKTGRHSNK